MAPADFRARPDGDRVEMMAHRREYQLRKAHAEHAGDIVSRIFAEKERKK